MALCYATAQHSLTIYPNLFYTPIYRICFLGLVLKAQLFLSFLVFPSIFPSQSSEVRVVSAIFEEPDVQLNPIYPNLRTFYSF